MANILKAVLFDLDDTLIDWSTRTEDWREYDRQHLQLVAQHIAAKGYTIADMDEFYLMMSQQMSEAWATRSQTLEAPHVGDMLYNALLKVGVPTSLINIEACLRAYDWKPLEGVDAFPDAVEILPLLVSHGVQIGIITNAAHPMWMRDLELHAFGLLAHFADCRLSAADVGFLKPHPIIFKNALECLDASAEEVVFVGDNPETDIAGAQTVGMRAVLRVVNRPPSMISGVIIPDGAINTLHELLPLLDEWYPSWRTQPPTDLDKVHAVDATLDGINDDMRTNESTPNHDIPTSLS